VAHYQQRIVKILECLGAILCINYQFYPGGDDLVVDGPIRQEPANIRMPLPQQQFGHSSG